MRKIEDTGIIPEAVASSVVNEVESFTGDTLGDAFIDELAADARRIFKANASFARKLDTKGNRGRDTLYSFMRHWLSSSLKKKRPAIYRKLPQEFHNGAPLRGLSGLAGFGATHTVLALGILGLGVYLSGRP